MSRKQLTLILALQLLAVVSVGAYLMNKTGSLASPPPEPGDLPAAPASPSVIPPTQDV
ncbi:hypothetical protein GVX82_05010 [Patescibacteria group bacterium]|nr:hypothetical protein [Patescibacteria group bacterium]